MDLSKDILYVKLGARKLVNQMHKRSKLIPPNLEEAPQYIMKVTVNGTKYKRMLDSGADCSMSGIDNIKKKNKEGEYIKGSDGNKIREITKTTDKKTHVEDQSFVKSVMTVGPSIATDQCPDASREV
jgi:hypothetical protein